MAEATSSGTARRCPRRGALVGPRHEVPVDPTDFDVEGLPVIGCNRIHCGRCDALVRHAVDPGAGRRRRYECRCSHWLEGEVQLLDDDDREAFRVSPDVPWKCAGHPHLLLPHDVDGAHAGSRKDLEALVHHALVDGQLPPRVREADRAGAIWLARLHARLSGEDAALVVDVALACLVDSSAAARARALALCAHLDETGAHQEGSAHARERVLELFIGHRGLFEVDDDCAPHRTLEESAWRLLAPLVAAPGPARDQARADALGGRGSRALFSAIAAGDPAWFFAHALAMAQATPARAEELHDAFAQLPDNGGGDFRGTRAAVRAAIAETITLTQALARTLHPVLAWDHFHHDRAQACVFEARSWGASLIKSEQVGLDERELWNQRARARQGRVGATHAERNLVWVFDDDRVGVWDSVRELVRGDATRILLQGSFVPTQAITRVISFDDAPPDGHRGVRVVLDDGREVAVHDEVGGPQLMGSDHEPIDVVWPSHLATDLATWLGVLHVDHRNGPMNTRHLELRAPLRALADALVPGEHPLGACDDAELAVRLTLEGTAGGGPATDGDGPRFQLELLVTGRGRAFAWPLQRGRRDDVVRFLKHGLTPGRILARARGG